MRVLADRSRRGGHAGPPSSARVLGLLAALALSGCSSRHESPPPPPAAPAPPEAAPPLAGQQLTEPLVPSPVRLEDAEGAAAELSLVDRPADARLRVPEGFRVQLYAEGLEAPDALTMSPEGDLLVTERDAGRIHRLLDADRDFVAEARAIFGDETNALDHPHGMVFTPGAVFVANREQVDRHAYPEGRGRLIESGRRIGPLPDAADSDRHALVLAPDRLHLYVGVADAGRGLTGEERGALLELSFSGARRRVFARPLPYTTALASRRGTIFATVLRRPGAERLVEVTEGELSPEAGLRFAPASGVTSLAFYGSSAFPARYRGGAFVSLDGRAPGIVFVPFDDAGAPADHYEPFVGGFASGDGQTWARPRGLLAAPDGSLFFTDGVSRVFRVTWAG